MMPTLVTFLQAQGTEMTTKAAHSPSSNSDPEVKNRAIFNAVRKALTTIGIEHRYWTYTAADAVNKLNFIPQRQPDGLYRPPIIALGAPDLPTTPTHLLPFGRRSYLTDTLATKRELAPRPLPARYLTVPSQHQFQVLLPNDTVRLVRASEFIPIIGDGSAPATVGQYPEVASAEHQGPAQPRCSGRRCADTLAEPSGDPSSPHDPRAQPTTEASHPRPRPAAERASPHRAGKCVQPLVPPTGSRHQCGGSPARPCRGPTAQNSGLALCAAFDQGSPLPPGRRRMAPSARRRATATIRSS
jgi:hypothetical protein